MADAAFGAFTTEDCISLNKPICELAGGTFKPSVCNKCVFVMQTVFINYKPHLKISVVGMYALCSRLCCMLFTFR
jgi:hypothetical protein